MTQPRSSHPSWAALAESDEKPMNGILNESRTDTGLFLRNGPQTRTENWRKMELMIGK